MRGLVFRLLITALGLWAAATIVPGVTIVGVGNLIVAALLLGLVNAVIRPIILILTLPLTLLTLGLFIFVINGLLFWLVGSFVQGFHVAGFWSAVGGAILYSIISWALSALLLPGKK